MTRFLGGFLLPLLFERAPETRPFFAHTHYDDQDRLHMHFASSDSAPG